MKTEEERFWEKVEKGKYCWMWTGMKERRYGRFKVNGKRVRAHLWAYEHIVGPVPEGLELDHLCRNRSCVNPKHLEPVTHRENILRGDTLPARLARVAECLEGHPFDEANTYITPDGRRACRTCRRTWKRESKRRLKLARAAEQVGRPQ